MIGTGYNDRIGTPFRDAVIAITDEAARQGVDVIWITYRQVRHVRGKATTMNKQLGKLDQRIENLHIADWNSFSEGKDKVGWFRGDRLHLVTPGAVGLAQKKQNNGSEFHFRWERHTAHIAQHYNQRNWLMAWLSNCSPETFNFSALPVLATSPLIEFLPTRPKVLFLLIRNGLSEQQRGSPPE